MVPFERALCLLSSYRPSMVTLPLSLCISEILPLLCLSASLFPTHLYSPQNFPMFPWDSVGGLWAMKSEGVGLTGRAISFQDFQAMWSWSTNVTDGWMDGRHAIARPRCTIVHRAVKSKTLIFRFYFYAWRKKTPEVWLEKRYMCFPSEGLRTRVYQLQKSSFREFDA